MVYNYAIKNLESDGDKLYVSIDKVETGYGMAFPQVPDYKSLFLKIDRRYYNGGDIYFKINTFN